MNDYSFEEITIGLSVLFEVKVEAWMFNSFRNITGDVNPLHCDVDYARSKGYSNAVSYGMLTASFLSTLAGVYLPGKRSLIHSVETKFARPVYAGDTLKIEGKVTEKNDLFKLLTLKVTMFNQNNDKVLKGIMKVGVKDE